MHAYLITGNGSERVEKEAETLAIKFAKKILEFPIAKIADVRELGSFLKLKVTKPTAIIVKNIDRATHEAANAFLKSLEEPQENVAYFLTAHSEEKVIPTIVSRCQVVIVRSEKGEVRSESKEISEFLDLSVGEKFGVIDKIKKREEAIEFVKSLIFYWHSDLSNNTDLTAIGSKLKEAQKTLSALQANGNVSIQLTRFVMNL